MAKDHRKVSEQLAQEILLEDPKLPARDRRAGAPRNARGADDRAHRSRTLRAECCSHRPPQRLQAEGSTHQGRYAEPAGASRPGRHLLNEAVLTLPKKREGTLFGAHADVRGGGLDQEGQGNHRRAVRDLLLQEPRLIASWLPRLGA